MHCRIQFCIHKILWMFFPNWRGPYFLFCLNGPFFLMDVFSQQTFLPWTFFFHQWTFFPWTFFPWTLFPKFPQTTFLYPERRQITNQRRLISIISLNGVQETANVLLKYVQFNFVSSVKCQQQTTFNADDAMPIDAMCTKFDQRINSQLKELFCRQNTGIHCHHIILQTYKTHPHIKCQATERNKSMGVWELVPLHAVNMTHQQRL